MQKVTFKIRHEGAPVAQPASAAADSTSEITVPMGASHDGAREA